MTILITAYGLAGVLVVAYCIRMVVQHGRLLRRLEELREHGSSSRRAA